MIGCSMLHCVAYCSCAQSQGTREHWSVGLFLSVFCMY